MEFRCKCEYNRQFPHLKWLLSPILNNWTTTYNNFIPTLYVGVTTGCFFRSARIFFSPDVCYHKVFNFLTGSYYIYINVIYIDIINSLYVKGFWHTDGLFGQNYTVPTIGGSTVHTVAAGSRVRFPVVQFGKWNFGHWFWSGCRE